MLVCYARVSEQTIRTMHCGRGDSSRLMQMWWALMRRGLFHPSPLFFAVSPVLFLFDVYALHLALPFTLLLFAFSFRRSWLTRRLAQRRQSEAGAQRWSIIGSMRLQGRLSRRALTDAGEIGQAVRVLLKRWKGSAGWWQSAWTLGRRLLWVVLRRPGSAREM